MPKFVRVKDKKSGHEFTVAEVRLADKRFADAVEVLDKPAVNASGKPLPAKPNVSIAARVAAGATDRGDQQGRGPKSKEQTP